MDDAVRCHDVGLLDRGLVDFCHASHRVDLDLFASQALEAGHLDPDIGDRDLSAKDVAALERNQRLLVLGLQKRVQLALGRLGEGLVSRREDGEGPLALKGRLESGRLDRLGRCLEVSGRVRDDEDTRLFGFRAEGADVER